MDVLSQNSDLFYGKVVPGPDNCWIWTAFVNKGGYGQASLNGRCMHAHRVSWMLSRGEIPDGMHVMHSCDTRRCVNPDHLSLGTNADNVADREEKGRGVYVAGAQQGSAKLTSAQARAIRKLYWSGLFSGTVLARQYGISTFAVYNVIAGRSYRNAG